MADIFDEFKALNGIRLQNAVGKYDYDNIENELNIIERKLKLGKLYKELAEELKLSIDIDDYDDGDISKSYEFVNVGMIEKELPQEKVIEIIKEIEAIENE